MSIFEAAPIADIVAERAVIASVLLTEGSPNASHARHCATGITEESFYDPRHGVIWQSIDTLVKRGECVDVITLVAELRSMNRLNTVGGAQYVGELTDEIPTLANMDSHAAIVVKLAILRRANAVGADVVAVTRSHESIDDRIAQVQSLSRGLQCIDVSPKRVSIAEHLLDAWEEFEKLALAKAAGHTIAARFGVEALDGSPDGRFMGMCGGIFRQNIVTIMGKPGGGKTTIAMQAAVTTAEDALAKTGDVDTAERVIVFASEMLGPQVSMRLACARSGIDFNRMRNGTATLEERQLVFEACNDLVKLPIDIIDSRVNRGRVSADDVNSHVLSLLSRDKKIGLVIVDYFQDLARCRGMEKVGETTEQEERARRLHSTVVDANVPMILISSMTKSAQKGHEEGKAGTTDARGAGLDYASDVMMGLVRIQDNDSNDDGKSKGNSKRPKQDIGEVPDGCVPVSVEIPKNRYGKTGDVTVLFDLRRGMFRDLIGFRSGGIPDSLPDEFANSNAPDTYSDMAGLETAPWDVQE